MRAAGGAVDVRERQGREGFLGRVMSELGPEGWGGLVQSGAGEDCPHVARDRRQVIYLTPEGGEVRLQTRGHPMRGS